MVWVVCATRNHFPEEFVPKKGSKLARRQQLFAYHDQLTAVWWYDNKDVYMLSTYLGNTYFSFLLRGGGNSIPVSCTELIFRLQLVNGWGWLSKSVHTLLFYWVEIHEVVAACLGTCMTMQSPMEMPSTSRNNAVSLSKTYTRLKFRLEVARTNCSIFA